MKPISNKVKSQAQFRSLLLAMVVAGAAIFSTHSRASHDGSHKPLEDFRMTNTALVWVVGDPSEPRASLIKKLPKGQVVSVLTRRDAWVRVAVIDGSGQGGYVLDRLLDPAAKEAIDRATASDQRALDVESIGNEYDGTDDNSSGFAQADVPKVWVVRDPSRIYDTLVRKLEEGEAVRVLSQGEIWSKVELSGTADTGYVMNRWTRPASFRSIRRFLNTPVSASRSSTPKQQPDASANKSAQGKGPYLVRKKERQSTKETQEARSPEPGAEGSSAPRKEAHAQPPDLKLAGVNLPGLPFKKKKEEAPPANDEGKASGDLSIVMLIVFAASAFGLFTLFMFRRSKHRLGDGAMDCLGKIRIDKHTALTLVRVPGKLLVMLKTKEGVDILREIHTAAEVAPAEARQILHDSFVGQLPRKAPGSRVREAAGMSDLSPAEALAMGGAPIPIRRASKTDPLQERLSSARERMRQVMGAS